MARNSMSSESTGRPDPANDPALAYPRRTSIGGESVSRSKILRIRLAGAAGFEPANAGTKNRCLTTWRRPNTCREPGVGTGLIEPPARDGTPDGASEKPLQPAVRIG